MTQKLFLSDVDAVLAVQWRRWEVHRHRQDRSDWWEVPDSDLEFKSWYDKNFTCEHELTGGRRQGIDGGIGGTPGSGGGGRYFCWPPAPPFCPRTDDDESALAWRGWPEACWGR